MLARTLCLLAFSTVLLAPATDSLAGEGTDHGADPTEGCEGAPHHVPHVWPIEDCKRTSNPHFNAWHQLRRNLEWHSPSGETVASGSEIYETAPAWTRYELDLVLGDDSLRVTHTYDPWNDRHATRLDDVASGWWVEYSTSSELSFATTEEAMRRGPLRMLEENPRIVVELETSDGWRREIAGPARMPGPAAEKRLHAGTAQRAPTIPETTVRGYQLLRQAVQNAQASKVILIEPLLEVVAPWLDEATQPTSESATTLIEEPAERLGHSP